MERVDTHQTVKDLIAAGLPDKQAEAITIAINNTSNLATKEDIRELQRDIKDVRGEIKHLEEKIETKLQDIRGEIKDVRVEIKHLEEKIEIKLNHLEDKIVNKLILWIVGSAFSITVSISGVLLYLLK